MFPNLPLGVTCGGNGKPHLELRARPLFNPRREPVCLRCVVRRGETPNRVRFLLLSAPREFVMTVPRAYPAEKAQTKFQHTIYIVGLAGTAVFVTFLAFV